MAQAIYTRLNAFSAYGPVSIKALCDPSIQAGDIIIVTVEGETRNIPVFTATIAPTRATYDCTGNVSRPVTSKEQRESWRAGRKYHDLTLDVDGLRSRIGNAEGDITSLELTASGLKTQIENAEGDISTLELSVSGLQSQVSGKIDGSTAQSMIDQSIGDITLSVSSSNGSSTFTLKAGQAELSTDTLNLTVNAVNVSGQLTASQIDATNLQVNGANIYNLKVTNAEIENLSCSKLTGYMPAARLSDPTQYLSDFYVNHVISNGYLAILVNGDIDQGYELNASGIKHAGSTTLWSTILSGGSAVFG